MEVQSMEGKKEIASKKGIESRLRHLDFDDLFLLTHLLDGYTIAATAKQLGLTQPAITQRVRKIERVWNSPILKKVGRHVRLTDEGKKVALQSAEALALMKTVTPQQDKQCIKLGIVEGMSSAVISEMIIRVKEDLGLNLDVVHLNSQSVVEALNESRIDAMLSNEKVAASRHSHVKIVGEEILLIGPKQSIANLDSEPEGYFYDYNLGSPYSSLISPTAKMRLQNLEVWHVGSLNAAVKVSRIHKGVTPIIESELKSHGIPKGFAVYSGPIDLGEVELYLTYQSDRHKLQKFEALQNCLQEAFGACKS